MGVQIRKENNDVNNVQNTCELEKDGSLNLGDQNGKEIHVVSNDDMVNEAELKVCDNVEKDDCAQQNGSKQSNEKDTNVSANKLFVKTTVNNIDNGTRQTFANVVTKNGKFMNNKLDYVQTEKNDEGEEVVVLGRPVIMDQMTASMCNNGYGRLRYARVLVEMEACKGLPDKIEVVYKDASNNIKKRKTVKVEYPWKPLVKKDENGVNREVQNKDSDGFVEARGRRNNGRNKQFQQRKQLLRPKEKQVNEKENGDLKRQENGQDNMNKDKGKSIVNEQNNGGEGTSKTPSSEMSNDEQNVVQNAGNQSSNRTDKKLNKYADVGSVERQDKDADAVNGKKYEEEFPALSKEARSKSQSITQKGNKNRFDVLGSVGNNDTLYSNDNQKCQDEGDLCRNKNGKSISMEENIVKENEEVDIFILWKKQEEMIDMFVNNKRNPTDEELETWARYMCEWYKERWEAKWKSKCPIVGRSIWIID
ncbi:hypothetical protein CTI12_AA218230 [Artemisia annua]|uniref:Uncharacterized protein n=1 Tax=Artemisia annua TaxID=35608 RepID=A0A2U1NXA7_ARTAN|nr:hypothetical protein CTI12_AA218230 [Artemisia annua]